MDSQATQRSWISRLTHGYTYISNLAASSLGLGDRTTDQEWLQDSADTQPTRKRKRQSSAIYSRLVPDVEGSPYHHNTDNMDFMSATAPSSSSPTPSRQIEETTTPNDMARLALSKSQPVSPPLSPISTTIPHNHVSSSTRTAVTNHIPTVSPATKVQMDLHYVSQLERVIDSLKAKIADMDSKDKTMTPESKKWNSLETNVDQESTSQPYTLTPIKSELKSHTHSKMELLTTTSSRQSTTTVSSQAQSSSSSTMQPTPMEPNNLDQGFLKRRKVLSDHPSTGLSLKHVNGHHRNTMDIIIHQIHQVKLRRTDMIRGTDGQWKPNPFWKEIYNNGKRKSRHK